MIRAAGIFAVAVLCVAIAGCGGGGNGGGGGTPTLTLASTAVPFAAVAGFGGDLARVNDHVTITGGNSAALRPQVMLRGLM